MGWESYKLPFYLAMLTHKRNGLIIRTTMRDGKGDRVWLVCSLNLDYNEILLDNAYNDIIA